jgi:uncharacterized membrane protein YqaE (UPF0057 family)
MQDDTAVIWITLVAIFCPWLAVLLERGCGADLVINIFLSGLFYFPGAIHALWCISHEREQRQYVHRRRAKIRAQRIAHGLGDSNAIVFVKWVSGFVGFVVAGNAGGVWSLLYLAVAMPTLWSL